MKSLGAVLTGLALTAAVPLTASTAVEAALATTDETPIGHPIRTWIHKIGSLHDSTEKDVFIILTPASCMSNPREKCAEDLCALHHVVQEDYRCGPLFESVRKAKEVTKAEEWSPSPVPTTATLRLRECEPFRRSRISDRCLRLICDIAKVHEPGAHTCQGRKDRRPLKKASSGKTKTENPENKKKEDRVMKKSTPPKIMAKREAPESGDDALWDVEDIDGGWEGFFDERKEDEFGLPLKPKQEEKQAEKKKIKGKKTSKKVDEEEEPRPRSKSVEEDIEIEEQADEESVLRKLGSRYRAMKEQVEETEEEEEDPRLQTKWAADAEEEEEEEEEGEEAEEKPKPLNKKKGGVKKEEEDDKPKPRNAKWNDFRSEAAKEREKSYWYQKMKDRPRVVKPKSKSKPPKKNKKGKEGKKEGWGEWDEYFKQGSRPGTKKKKQQKAKFNRPRTMKIKKPAGTQHEWLLEEMEKGEDAKHCWQGPDELVPCWMLSFGQSKQYTPKGKRA